VITMTAPALSPDATRCPQCTAVLTGTDSCDSCGLRLTGPEASRLWQVDQELLQLEAARRPLLVERSALLAALRGERPAASAPVLPPVAVQPTPPPPPPAPEWTPQRVSNTLLGLGGLLLAVAALVFTAVTYERLGAGGRATILLALTLVAGLAAPRARLRGLTSTAETLTAVTLVLAALDAYGLRKLGLGAGTGPLVYAAVSAGALCALSAGYAALVPVRLARIAAVGLAQLPVPLVLLHTEPSPAAAAGWLAALAAADVAAVAALRGRAWAGRDVPVTAALCGALVLVPALLLAAIAGLAAQPGAGAVALIACAAVVAGGATLARDPGLRLLLSALPVGILALAAHAIARPELSEVQSPLVPAAVALLAVQAGALLPRAWRAGPMAGAVVVAGAAVAAVAEQVVTGVLGPLGWLLDPWSVPAGASAREALSPSLSWDGTLVTPVVLAAAAGAVIAAAVGVHRLRLAAVPAAALGALATVLLPLGLDLPLRAGLAVLVLAGGAAVLAPRPDRLDLPLSAAGTGVLLLSSAWALAEQGATLVVLAAVAVTLSGLAVRTTLPVLLAPAAALTGLLAAGELAALGAAADLTVDQVGALLVLAAAALVGAAAPALGAARRSGLEVAACLVAVVAIGLAAPDPGWLSWSLAGLGLAALAGALRPDRRPLALAGALLLAASSWVRLADAGVTDPEPYVLPLAAAALLLGHLRRRAQPGTSSFAAYGAGLSLALVPSLLASYAGSPLWRPLTLAVAALAVVLLGARERLQAPLVIAGAVLAADALLLLAPYAAALPRWLILGAAGTLLVGLGATYEQRLRDLGRLRERFDRLA
jgi:hypothetical protein